MLLKNKTEKSIKIFIKKKFKKIKKKKKYYLKNKELFINGKKL